MSAQLAQTQQPFTKYDAKQARQNYQHIAAVVNRILYRAIQSLSPEDAKKYVKRSVFGTIHSLHGFFHGQPAKNFPLIKAHKFVVPHFDYHGDPENAARFMDRRLDALAVLESAVGRRFIGITRADNITLLYTAYESHPLLDAAEAIYFKARQKANYWKNAAAAITDDLLDEAIAMLPEVKQEQPAPIADPEEDGGERWGSGDLMNGAIVKGMWTKVLNGAASALEKEFDTGSDPELAAMLAAKKIIALGKTIKATRAHEVLRAAMSPASVVSWRDADHDQEKEHRGKNSVPSGAGGSPAEETPTLDKNVVVPPHEVVTNQQLNDFDFSESRPSVLLGVALDYASQGLAVLPLWGVSDGICDCSQGSECRSAGKHPHSTLARRQTPDGLLKGVYSATTDEAVIREWFALDPRLNLGLAMGGALNLVCVDIDPRNAGDTTYYDLVEAHGDDAFPETFIVKTGGGGWHRLYRLPEAIKPKKGELKGKLGPGIDIKGEGGLIVAVGSVHSSGRVYEVETNTYIAEAPQWIVESLIKSVDGSQPEKVIDFQAHRDRKRAGISGSVIVEGERNERLFKIGCAMWGRGEVGSHSELYSYLVEVNLEKVSSPLSPSEVIKIAQSISSRYQLGSPINQEVTA